MPPLRWKTLLEAFRLHIAVAFSQRMPPVQNIATFCAIRVPRLRGDLVLEIAEALGLRIDGVGEGADGNLVVVAGVDRRSSSSAISAFESARST